MTKERVYECCKWPKEIMQTGKLKKSKINTIETQVIINFVSI